MKRKWLFILLLGLEAQLAVIFWFIAINQSLQNHEPFQAYVIAAVLTAMAFVTYKKIYGKRI